MRIGEDLVEVKRGYVRIKKRPFRPRAAPFVWAISAHLGLRASAMPARTVHAEPPGTRYLPTMTTPAAEFEGPSAWSLLRRKRRIDRLCVGREIAIGRSNVDAGACHQFRARAARSIWS